VRKRTVNYLDLKYRRSYLSLSPPYSGHSLISGPTPVENEWYRVSYRAVGLLLCLSGHVTAQTDIFGDFMKPKMSDKHPGRYWEGRGENNVIETKHKAGRGFLWLTVTAGSVLPRIPAPSL